MRGVVQVPGHQLAVTGDGPMGRAWVDCECGYTVVRASKHAANLQALHHQREVEVDGADDGGGAR